MPRSRGVQLRESPTELKLGLPEEMMTTPLICRTRTWMVNLLLQVFGMVYRFLQSRLFNKPNVSTPQHQQLALVNAFAYVPRFIGEKQA
jgi:hypothetical protein